MADLGQTIGTHLLLHILSIMAVAGSIWPSLGIYCQCSQPLVFKSPASRTSALTLLAEFLDALTVTGVVKKGTPTQGGVMRVKGSSRQFIISLVGLITTMIPIFISHEIPIPKSSTSSQSIESIFLLLFASLHLNMILATQLSELQNPSFSARVGSLQAVSKRFNASQVINGRGPQQRAGFPAPSWCASLVPTPAPKDKARKSKMTSSLGHSVLQNDL